VSRLPWIPIAAALAMAPAPPRTPETPVRLTLERVARFPPPGTRVPGSFRFGPDGRYLYFLHGEDGSVVRSLYREEIATGRRELLARPPGGEDGDRDLSREEILRRERRRLQDRGITQYVVADRAEVAVFSWRGDAYLARPGSEPLRLTETAEEEIDPQLSPDGTRLAYVRGGEIHVLDLSSRAERRLTDGARDGVTHGLAEFIAQEEMDRSSGFWWSPDGARLAYTEVDETAIPVYPIVHQGKAAIEIETHRYPFAGGPNARVRLGIVAASGGPTLWLRLADPEEDVYLARAGWAKDDSLLAQVESRDQTRLRLIRFEATTGEGTLLLEDRAETWINLHDDLKPLDDGRFLWSSESGGFRHLELRGPDGRLLRALTGGPWAVDGLAGVDPAAGRVYFTAARDGPLQRRLYRVGLDGSAIERLTPEPGTHAVTVSPDGRHLVDVHDSATTPPRVLLRDGDGRTVRVIEGNDDPEPRALGLRAPEFVTLEARDGTVLHGAVFRPRRLVPGRRYPALVSVYGGPTAQKVKDSWEVTQNLRTQHLVQSGYVVFLLDNRGTPRRGRAFEAELHRRLGSVEVEDQAAGARYLARLPYVDAGRIGIFGWSYGGYVAALCLLKEPDLFRAAVAGAPVTDWDGYDTHYTERYMGTPRDNPEGYRAASVLPLAPGLEGRLLIIHGMADENVHFRHTARLVNALNAAGKEYDLLVFPDERHLPRGEEDRVHLERRLVRHFDRHLKRR
jgi:dipeptidyl-peptidase-4